MQQICKDWRVTEEEYLQLDEQFGRLSNKQAWILLQKNCRNNHTDEQEDVAQEMRIAMIRAGSYYKRQTYIEACLRLCYEHVEDKFLRLVVRSLKKLWKNKTRHGANRQKFGPDQETILGRLVRKYVPAKVRPNKKARLVLDTDFLTYCKSITWNAQKAMGKKISREKPLRSKQVSISEYDFLAV